MGRVAQLPPSLPAQFKEGQAGCHTSRCDIQSCSLLIPRHPSKNVRHRPGLLVPPFLWMLPDLPHPQGDVGGSSSSLTQRISVGPSLPSCSAILPLMLVAPLAFLPLSLSFPAPWHYFFIRLQLVKMMPTSSGAVARAELRHKYVSAGKQ